MRIILRRTAGSLPQSQSHSHQSRLWVMACLYASLLLPDLGLVRMAVRSDFRQDYDRAVHRDTNAGALLFG